MKNGNLTLYQLTGVRIPVPQSTWRCLEKAARLGADSSSPRRFSLTGRASFLLEVLDALFRYSPGAGQFPWALFVATQGTISQQVE